MKASTRKKISVALKRYHACARRSGCGRKKRVALPKAAPTGKKGRRVALTKAASTGKKGRISRAASKGQRTAARLLRELEKKAAEYDKKYSSVLF